LGRGLGLIAAVFWPTPAGNGSYRVPSYLHPFAPDPYKGPGNRKDNSDPHIVYEFYFTPIDKKTPILKYGISDVSRYGMDRPDNQLAAMKAAYGASANYRILTRTVNRATALFIEQSLVTKHVATWKEMPREQTRPGPFNF
jgi:hypothetical protein